LKNARVQQFLLTNKSCGKWQDLFFWLCIIS
jgi:hypothetical protein